MVSSKYIQQVVLKKYTEHQIRSADSTSTQQLFSDQEQDSKHLQQFIRMAELRKKQILERMLMD